MKALSLFSLLPESCWILLIVGAGFCLMFGFRKTAMGILLTVIGLALLTPFLDSLMGAIFDSLNTPGQFLLMAILMVLFFAWMIKLILGSGVKDRFVSKLLYDTFLLPFRIIGWILKILVRRCV